ncbi:MAG TPA: C25 family cysteine peptidase, partial [bacterium]|nr:C25 family cysteine peptidase [bacterium]
MVNIRRILLGILFFAPLLLFSGVNLGPLQPLSTSGIIAEKVLDGASGSVKTFSITFKEPTIGSTGQYTVLNVDGCSITNKYGYQLPVKNISFELPKNASVSSVRITNGRWQEIEGEFNLPPHPYPLPGGAREELGTGAREELGTGAREGSNILLPGTFLDAGYSQMANTTIVSISVYPVQYNPGTKKTFFLKEVDIEVSYGVETENIPQVLTPLASSGDYSAQFIDSTSECIIITPEKYKEYANRLKTLHENQKLGSSIPTRVVTIEEIAANPYGATGQPPLSPLPTSLCPEGDFTNHTDTTTYPNRNTRLYPRFNQWLARKMLSFLLDCHDAPGYENPVGGTQVGYYSMHKLQYIVILGNANEVPPSDYVYSTVWGGADGIENWIPTDYFYSACGREGISLTPHTGIGRIPVSRAEAEDIFKNLTITGLSNASRTITFQIPDTEDPSVIEAGKTVVLRSGLANGRWLDIQSVSISGPSGGYYTVTLTLRANRNNGEAWMTDPEIATGDRIDIIDTRQQMDDIITKLEQWVNARGTDDNWFRVISFAGGKYIPGAITKYENTTASFYSASLASLYRDELSCVEAINKIDDDPYYGDGYSYVAGLDVKKYFASDIKPDWSKYDEAFLKDDIESILQNSSQTGILYFAGSSGYLYTLTMEDNNISSSDILGYPG